MIGFNASQSMMALLQRRGPTGLADVSFASRVGVAPGTTMLCLGGPNCPPDPPGQYMVARPGGGRASAARSVSVQYAPYGSETSMSGLGVADMGPAWSKVGLIALGAALLGAGVAVVMARRSVVG